MEPRHIRWDIYPRLDREEIAYLKGAMPEANLPDMVVQLLANRGIRDHEQIRRFIKPPEVKDCPDPRLMVGMHAAVQRIERAIANNEKIVVYGDFDADGVTSTALLSTALKHFGANVVPYVPHRFIEGYGLNMEALRTISKDGARLVITVDCGISNNQEAREAKALGLDLIVTDHHHLPSELPDAICINPKQHVDGCEDFEYLAGVGVAYQLVRALVLERGGRKPAGLRNADLLALVAIGTVADVAQLRGANRSLVMHGLAALPKHSLPGIQALLDSAHVSIDTMDTERIGFVIGPRLNAAGRLDDARTAYQLLMTEDNAEARKLAQQLEAHNRRRQALTNSMTDQARQKVLEMENGAELILLHAADWQTNGDNPLGVVGLVAGKLAEEFGRPALVLAPGGNEGESRGSARSVQGFDMHAALTQVADLLVQFGGHSAAAGLTVRDTNVAELRRRLCEQARQIPADQSAEASVIADSEIRLADVSFKMLSAINTLAPFGAGNPLPLFMARGVRAVEAFPLRDGAHLKLMLEDRENSTQPLEAIAFRMAHMAPDIKRHKYVDVLFYIERREWNGNVHLQLRVRDMRIAI